MLPAVSQETLLWQMLFQNLRGCAIDRGLRGTLNRDAGLISLFFSLCLFISPDCSRRVAVVTLASFQPFPIFSGDYVLWNQILVVQQD